MAERLQPDHHRHTPRQERSTHVESWLRLGGRNFRGAKRVTRAWLSMSPHLGSLASKLRTPSLFALELGRRCMWIMLYCT